MIPASIQAHLDTPFPVSPDQIGLYRDQACIMLKDVLNVETLAFFEREITEQVLRLNTEKTALENRDTYGKAFLQVTNLWTHSDVVKTLVFSRRLASVASTLMEVEGVRLYHDQALYKEAGGGYTPWHTDQYYWPLASQACITAWIPLQETSLEMGALEYAAGSHTLEIGRDQPISDKSEALIHAALSEAAVPIIAEPFSLGEVGFHAGWLFHRAAPNTTSKPRKVMCVIYMDRDMRLKEPSNNHQRLDWEVWCPGSQVGDIIDTPLNPVLV
jgi:ectoine hydroxylase-related dioxygenase (phytanoyl-CoA dioxygenase family)